MPFPTSTYTLPYHSTFDATPLGSNDERYEAFITQAEDLTLIEAAILCPQHAIKLTRVLFGRNAHSINLLINIIRATELIERVCRLIEDDTIRHSIMHMQKRIRNFTLRLIPEEVKDDIRTVIHIVAERTAGVARPPSPANPTDGVPPPSYQDAVPTLPSNIPNELLAAVNNLAQTTEAIMASLREENSQAIPVPAPTVETVEHPPHLYTAFSATHEEVAADPNYQYLSHYEVQDLANALAALHIHPPLIIPDSLSSHTFTDGIVPIQALGRTQPATPAELIAEAERQDVAITHPVRRTNPSRRRAQGQHLLQVTSATWPPYHFFPSSSPSYASGSHFSTDYPLTGSLGPFLSLVSLLSHQRAHVPSGYDSF
jgi:hypothetical protein